MMSRGRDVFPATSCSTVSAGCDHCYAETFKNVARGAGAPVRAGLRRAVVAGAADVAVAVA
jgi:protein gp37